MDALVNIIYKLLFRITAVNNDLTDKEDEPTILWEGSIISSNENIPLSDYIQNYKYIEVISNAGSEKFRTNNSSSITCNLNCRTYDTSNLSNLGIVFLLQYIHFTNNNWALGNCYRWYWYASFTGGPATDTSQHGGRIYIYKIIGYKK